MKKFLKVLLIIITVIVLLLVGLVLAARPPFTVVSPRETEYTEIEDVMNAYLLERATIAFDGYPGEGELNIVLEEEGLSQALADALYTQTDDFPKGMEFLGALIRIGPETATVSGSFKFSIITFGLSAKVEAEIEGEDLKAQLLSAKLGRVPLPLKLILNLVGKFTELPEEVAAMAVTLPLGDEEDEDEEFNITNLSLQAGEIVLSIPAPDFDIFEVSVKEMKEYKSEIAKTFPNNHVAVQHIENFIVILEKAQAEGKRANPLRLDAEYRAFFAALSDEEVDRLIEEELIDQETLDYLESNLF